MNWIDWIEQNQDWAIFFSIFIVISILIILFINPRGKKRGFLAFILILSNFMLFIIKSPYNYLFVVTGIISLIYLLNGKHMWTVITEEPEGIFINSNPSNYQQYSEPPETKKIQEKSKEDI